MPSFPRAKRAALILAAILVGSILFLEDAHALYGAVYPRIVCVRHQVARQYDIAIRLGIEAP